MNEIKRISWWCSQVPEYWVNTYFLGVVGGIERWHLMVPCTMHYHPLAFARLLCVYFKKKKRLHTCYHPYPKELRSRLEILPWMMVATPLRQISHVQIKTHTRHWVVMSPHLSGPNDNEHIHRTWTAFSKCKYEYILHDQTWSSWIWMMSSVLGKEG